MSQQDVELVRQWEAMLPSGTELKSAFDDDEFLSRMRQIVDSEATTRFVDAEGGPLGDNEPERRGFEGLQAGWGEWLEAWEEFRIEYEEYLDAGEGTVLVLVKLSGRTSAGVDISHPGAAVFSIRAGQMLSMEFYMDREQARRDAGLD
jgi:hypothetical protein